MNQKYFNFLTLNSCSNKLGYFGQRDERALKILNPEEILISNYVCFGAPLGHSINKVFSECPKGEDSISKSFTRRAAEKSKETYY